MVVNGEAANALRFNSSGKRSAAHPSGWGYQGHSINPRLERVFSARISCTVLGVVLSFVVFVVVVVVLLVLVLLLAFVVLAVTVAVAVAVDDLALFVLS